MRTDFLRAVFDVTFSNTIRNKPMVQRIKTSTSTLSSRNEKLLKIGISFAVCLSKLRVKLCL
jgi:hypothetical protein